MDFVRRADMLDTKIGAAKKGRPQESGERWI
jgi:hypothetical protein